MNNQEKQKLIEFLREFSEKLKEADCIEAIVESNYVPFIKNDDGTWGNKKVIDIHVELMP